MVGPALVKLSCLRATASQEVFPKMTGAETGLTIAASASAKPTTQVLQRPDGSAGASPSPPSLSVLICVHPWFHMVLFSVTSSVFSVLSMVNTANRSATPSLDRKRVDGYRKGESDLPETCRQRLRGFLRLVDGSIDWKGRDDDAEEARHSPPVPGRHRRSGRRDADLRQGRTGR